MSPPGASPGGGAEEKTPRRRTRAESGVVPPPRAACGRSRNRLILPDLTAIGVGLSHASRAPGAPGAAHGSVTRAQPDLGRGTTPGNWGWSPIGEGRWKAPSPKGISGDLSGSARGWGHGPSGCWRGNGPPSRRRVGAVRAVSPEMGTETRAQALRGAAGANTPQCGKPRRGHPECRAKSPAFARCKEPGE